ncbi:MAG: leucine-rich repeat protein [Lachnospiraceae bacterium]
MRNKKKIAALMLAGVLAVTTCFGEAGSVRTLGTMRVEAAEMRVENSSNWTSASMSEALSAEWEDSQAKHAKVYYKRSESGSYIQVTDGQLIRQIDNQKARVDLLGLPAGNYDLKIISSSGTTYEKSGIAVSAYDRSGYAHFQYTSGVGAYQDTGALKNQAIVVYVTEENKNSVTIPGYESYGTGIGNILNGKGNSAPLFTALAKDQKALDIRLIGTVTAPEGLTEYDGTGNGGTKGDNGNMAIIRNAKNITIEGVGSDACINGWGISFFVGSGFENHESYEVRNLTFKNAPEDALGFQGAMSGSKLTDPIEHVWVHHNSFYPGYCANPAESDKAEGDGSCDFKRGQYATLAYNYYEKCHKTNLLGASDSNLQFHLTFHHNYYKDCASRMPLVRQADIHLYNNYFVGSTSTTVDARASAFVFSEANYFEKCKRPVKTDAATTIVKSYGDVFDQCTQDNKATVVTDRAQTISGNCTYANFDTNAQIFYYDSAKKVSNVAHLTDAQTAKQECLQRSGAGKESAGVEIPIVQPSQPSEPSKPSESSKPSEPSKPSESSKPVSSSQPGGSGSLGETSQPVSSSQPGGSGSLGETSQPGSSGQSGSSQSTGDCGKPNTQANVKWEYDKATKTLTLRGEGETADQAAAWDAFRSDIAAVKVESGVTSLGKTLFKDCTNLVSVNLPASVNQIAAETFDGCGKLAKIVVNSSNKTYCSKNDSLFTKDFKTLLRAAAKKDLNILAGVETVERCAVTGAVVLQKVRIPESVTKISGTAFSGCTNLAQFTVDENNKNYSSDAYGLYTKDQTIFVRGCAKEEIKVADSVTEIGQAAFAGCQTLKNIQLPKGLTKIGGQAFADCKGLETVEIPESVKSIEADAFEGCEHLMLSVTSGSYAQTYAKEQQIPYRLNGEPVSEPASEPASEPTSEPSQGSGSTSGSDSASGSGSVSKPDWIPSFPSEWPSLPGGLPSIPGEWPSIPSGLPSLPGEWPSLPGFPSEWPSLPSIPGEWPSIPSWNNPGENPSNPDEKPSKPSDETSGSRPSEEPGKGSEPSEKPGVPSEEVSRPSENPSEPPSQSSRPSKNPSEPPSQGSHPSENTSVQPSQSSRPSEESNEGSTTSEPSQKPEVPSTTSTPASVPTSTPSSIPSVPSESQPSVKPSQPKKVEKLTVKETTVTLKLKQTKKLTVKLKPTDAADKSLKCTSNEPKIVKVSANGTLTAKKAGVAKVTIASKENPKAKQTITVKVKPNAVSGLKKKAVAKNQIKVEWKKQSAVTGYEVSYAVKTKKKTAKAKVFTTKKNTAVLKKLNANTTYKIKVRAYTKNKNGTVYGDFSKELNVKTAKK